MSVPRTIVVMGVSGAGKSTFGAALASVLGRAFIDADDLHPAPNKAKMASGIPLTDTDRAPWLDTVAAAAREAGSSVVACSALKRAYRERLTTDTDIGFLELVVPPEELARRLGDRTHEFMPTTLLASQLATLEPLAPDEPGARFDYATPGTLDDDVARAVRLLAEPQPRASTSPAQRPSSRTI